MTSFYASEELKNLGLKNVAPTAQISRLARFYGAENIEVGECSRIDDFAILSGRVKIGRFVHISPFVSVVAGELGVEFEDFCALSWGVRVFGSSDDYSGESLTNPCIPREFKAIRSQKILVKKHSIVGTNSVILPSCGLIGEGVSVGALSLVVRNLKGWGVYFGAPCRRIAERSRNLLALEAEFLAKFALNPTGGGRVPQTLRPHWGGGRYKTPIRRQDLRRAGAIQRKIPSLLSSIFRFFPPIFCPFPRIFLHFLSVKFLFTPQIAPQKGR